ncbi:MAG: DUF4363 family protein [Oscillospiraceae bacterium]
MKRFVISIVLLVVMSAGCVWSVYEVNSVSEKLSQMVSDTEDAFERGDDKACVEAAKKLQDEWNSFMDLSILINDLGHALEITSSISEIYSFAQEGNEELYASCDRAQAQIEMFRKMQLPTFWKIL